MSKNIQAVGQQLKAPRYLVEAAQKGEHIPPLHKSDTHATHLRRISKAIATYICAAVLLVGVAAAVPALVGEKAPAPASQPSAEGSVSEPVRPIVYTPVPEDAASTYVRSDLIWANELNPALKDFVIWTGEVVDGVTKGDSVFTLPDIAEGYSGYSVEIAVTGFDTDTTLASAPVAIMRRWVAVETYLLELGFEKLGTRSAADGESVDAFIYAATPDQLRSLDPQTMMLDAYVDPNLGNVRFTLRIAWQSLEGDLELAYSVKASEG